MNTMAPARAAELHAYRVRLTTGPAAAGEARGQVRATDGRGLMLVAALSAKWGAYRTPAGKVVYFTLAFQPDHAGTGGARPQGNGRTDERTRRAS